MSDVKQERIPSTSFDILSILSGTRNTPLDKSFVFKLEGQSHLPILQSGNSIYCLTHFRA